MDSLLCAAQGRMLLASIVLLASISACSREYPSPEAWILSDGQELSEAFADDSLAVLLVIDPNESFQCQGILAEWLEWRRQGGHFLLLFSRTPTSAERHALSGVGLEADDTVIDRGPPEWQTPIELVVDHGTVVYVAPSVRGPTSALAQFLRDMPLAAFVQRRRDDRADSQPLGPEGRRK